MSSSRSRSLQCLLFGLRKQRVNALFTHALRLNPSFAVAYNNRGLALQYLGRYREALADHMQALLLQPSFDAAHNNKGNALYRLGRYEEALRAYDQAIAIDNRVAVYHRNRGHVLKRLGRLEEAQRAYRRARQLGDGGKGSTPSPPTRS